MKEVYAIGDIIITGFNPQIYKIRDIHTSWGGENSYGTFELGKLVPRLPHYQINHVLTAKLQNFIKLRDSGYKFCVLVESEEEKNLYLDWMSYLGYNIGSRRDIEVDNGNRNGVLFYHVLDEDWYKNMDIEFNGYYGQIDSDGYEIVKFSVLGEIVEVMPSVSTPQDVGVPQFMIPNNSKSKRDVDVREYRDERHLDDKFDESDKIVREVHDLDVLEDLLTVNTSVGNSPFTIVIPDAMSGQNLLKAIRYYQRSWC